MSIGVASAHENTTDALSDDSTVFSDDEGYNARIIAEDMREQYSPYGNDIIFNIEDMEGKPIDDAKPTVTYDNRKVRAGYDSEHFYSGDDGTYVLDVDPAAGNHKVRIELNTSKYRAEPVFMNVKIYKATTIMSLKKYVTTTSEYAVLKAKVKDDFDNMLSGGKVKFKINGKTYSAKVKDGVATKKIKLSKAKTYTYSATFTSKNFKTKTVKSKIYIKKAKKYYTLKITNPKIDRTFKVNLPYKKYVKILNAKNNGKHAAGEVNTGIKRPESYGGGVYVVGLSTNDEYFVAHGYDKGDYIFLYGGGGYLCLRKVNLYTANF